MLYVLTNPFLLLAPLGKLCCWKKGWMKIPSANTTCWTMWTCHMLVKHGWNMWCLDVCFICLSFMGMNSSHHTVLKLKDVGVRWIDSFFLLWDMWLPVYWVSKQSHAQSRQENRRVMRMMWNTRDTKRRILTQEKSHYSRGGRLLSLCCTSL